MTLTALITRPEEDAQPLAEALAARGIATVIEPLLTIQAVPAAAARLATDLYGVQALLFTSANGVRAFAGLSARRDIGVLAVGDATAAAARAAGFSAVESAGGDVQDLARLVKQRLKPSGGPLFHAAGSAVAGDLAQLLSADGFDLRRRMLYESKPAEALSLPARQALATGGVDLVLLFSPRTAATFAGLVKASGIATRGLTALCLSPAVATAIGSLPWRRIETATRPDLPAMLELVDIQMQANPKADPAPAQPASLAEPAKSTSQPISQSARPTVAPPAVAPPALAPPPGPVARGGIFQIFLAGLIGALIAAGAVLGLLRYAPDRLGLAPLAGDTAKAGASADQFADLSARLAALQAQVANLPKPAPDLPLLSDRITSLQGDVAALKSASAAAPAPLPAEISGLPARFSDLEGRVAELKPGALPAELAALPARLAVLEQRLASGNSPANAAALTQITADVAALADRLKAAETALADLASLKQNVEALAAGAGKTAAARAGVALAIEQLHLQIAGGKPFNGVLDSLTALAAGDPALAAALSPSIAALKAPAEGGVPTLADLQATFPAVADAVLRAASASSEAASANGTFGDRVLARLASLVSIRPVGDGASGDDPPARIARAEARLAAGDVESSVKELSALPAGAVADAAKPWLDSAAARLDADRAFDQLQTAALGALAAAARAPAGAAQ